MTAIAGITDGTTTWIAADSSASDDGGLDWPATDKLVRVRAGRGVAVLAFSGNGRLKGAMRDMLMLSDPGAGDLDVWARDTARRINGVALDQRPPIVNPDDEPSGFDGIALLGYRGRLWRIACDTAIPVLRSAAIGSGGDIAYGAMRALCMHDVRTSDQAIVLLAVSIACADQTDCSLPVDAAAAT